MKSNLNRNLFLIAGLLLLAGAFNLKAASGTWTADASGQWGTTGDWAGGTVASGTGNTADFSTINITGDHTVTLDQAYTISVLKFGDTVPDHNWIVAGGSGPYALTLGTTPTINVVNQTATISAALAGTAGLTKTGAGALTLGGATETVSGGVIINAGTLTLDFTASGSPSANIFSSQALTLGGGALTVNGNASVTSAQTFSGTTFSSGAGTVSAVSGAGGTANLTLGSLTHTAGSDVLFSLPTTGSIGTSGASITAALLGYGVVANGNGASASDFAGLNTTSQIVPGKTAVPGSYGSNPSSGAVTATAVIEFNVNETGNLSLNNNVSPTSSLLFDTSTTFAGGWALVSGSGSKTWNVNQIMVTSGVGAENVTFSLGGTALSLRNGTSGTTFGLEQYNTGGFLKFINAGINNGGTTILIQSGPGTVVLAANGYTGQSYLNGGVTEIASDAGLGAAATAATVNMNGGTILATATFTLDNAGANFRPIALGNNGGGLAAVNTFTMTVDGVVSGAAGTGSLIIGLPTTGGKVPGTGSGTANTTEVDATGTVILNNTANTYTGGTVIDSGILQMSGASLAASGNSVFGTGGLTLNGGTFQWPSANTADISTRTITLASGGGTLDVNGSTVLFNNSIGNSGSGALTVKDTAGGGSLTLSAAATYTGATTVGDATHPVTLNVNSTLASSGVTVNNNATFGGTGTIAGNVTFANGSSAKLTQGSPLTVSGTVAFNGTGSGNTVTVVGSGLTSSGSPYTLLTASSISGTINPSPAGGAIADGYNGSVSISGGNKVILTVTAAGVVSAWTDGDANQNWSDSLNWSAGVPHVAGDTATFLNNAVNNAVTLDAPESVASITFSNASSDVISGANTLTLDNSTFGASIIVSNGTANAINTPVSLNDNTTVIAATGTSVTLGGTVANTSGSKTLTISGGGTSILSQANTYGPSTPGTVGTTLGGATVQVGNNTALGSGDVSVTTSSKLQSGTAGLTIANNIAVATLQTATVDNNGNALTLGGLISGSGAVSAIGSGSLALSGNNTYSGGTTLAASSQLNINYGGSSALNSAIGTGTLTINGGTIDNTGAGDVTLLPAIAQNWNGDFTYAGSVHNLNLGSGAVTLGASRQVTVSANTLTVGGVISGSAFTLTKAGNGTLFLGGANVFTNTTTLTAGTLTLGNQNALQNSTLTMNGGALVFDSSVVGNAFTLGGLAAASSGAGYDISLLNNAGTPAAIALTVGGNNFSTTYNGDLSGTGASLTKNGSGTLTLADANYTGNTTVNGGVVLVTGGSFGSSSATVAVAYGGNGFQMTGGTAAAGTLNVGNNAGGATGASASITGTASAVFGNAQIGSANNTGGNITINTTGTVGLGAYAMGRDGGAATVGSTTSGLIINGGTVTSISILGGGGVGGRISDITLNGGSLTVGNSGSTGAFEIGSGTGNAFLTMTGGTLTYLGTDGLMLGNANVTDALSISGGTATLTGITLNPASSTATSTLTVTNSATLYLGSVGLVFGTGGTKSATFGTGTIGALADWSSSAPITLADITTFKAADDSSVAHNITLSGVLSGNGGVTKTGNGTLTLGASAGNSYSGNTTVSNGTLQVNNTSGSGTGGGNVTVQTNGTLGGSGTISGMVTNYGTMEAGSPAAVGKLTCGNSVLLEGGGTNAVKIVNAAGTTPGVNYDNVTVSAGNIVVVATGVSPFTIRPVAAPAADFNNVANYSWTIMSGTVINFAPADFTVDTSLFTVPTGGSFYVTTNNGATALLLVYISHQPVANPATYYRAAGTALKINVTNLVATYASDTAGDPLGLSSVSGAALADGMTIATTTNGSSIYYTASYEGSPYIILTPTNNLNESFSYAVTNSVYGSLMATNQINIIVTNAVGQVSGNIIANLSGGSITTSWAGVAGDNYVVQRATMLTPTANWTDIWSTNNVPGTFTYTDTFGDLGGIPPAQAFYRLRSN